MDNELTVKSNEEIASREKTTNSDLIAFTAKIMEIAKDADRNDVDSMRACFLRYLELCHDTNMKVGNLSAYMAMGIDRMIADRWVKGRAGSTPERQKLIQFVQSVCAQQREAMMAEGTLKEITGIFWQKCFDGFRDNEAIQQEVNNLLDREMKPDEVIEKYKNLLKE